MCKKILQKSLESLRDAHAVGIVQRDVKSQNFLLRVGSAEEYIDHDFESSPGPKLQLPVNDVKEFDFSPALIDFGVADLPVPREEGSPWTYARHLTFSGTVGYHDPGMLRLIKNRAPRPSLDERFRTKKYPFDQSRQKWDVFSFGLMSNEMIFGERLLYRDTEYKLRHSQVRPQRCARANLVPALGKM